MELGKIQTLKVLREKDFGFYLAEDNLSLESVLLPKKEAKDLKIGDEVSVFIYKDSEDRIIATRQVPKILVGEIKRLEVKEVSKIGAFLDIGLLKDILLPFREMVFKPKKGDEVLVNLYVDRSNRLAASMKIYPFLEFANEFRIDDIVFAYVYREKEYEYLVAISDRYYGAISKREIFSKIEVGKTYEFRVIRIREDKRIDLSLRKKAYEEIEEDAKKILFIIEKEKGILNFDDKADKELIKDKFQISKSAFKRAIGNLLKNKKVILEDGKIKIIRGSLDE